MYIDTEGTLGQERFRLMADGKGLFTEAGPHSIRFSHPPIFHVLCSGEPLNTCQMAMQKRLPNTKGLSDQKVPEAFVPAFHG